MEIIKIGSTDIFFDNKEAGKGKIVISDIYKGSFSHYWGSMGGDTLQQFILRISADYFAGKLCNEMYVFSAKKSVSNVRKHIKEEMSYELPWYENMEEQKELRAKLKEIENVEDLNSFVYQMEKIHEGFCEIEDILRDGFQEPWHFIGKTTSNEYNFLCDLFRKIQKHILKSTYSTAVLSEN